MSSNKKNKGETEDMNETCQKESSHGLLRGKAEEEEGEAQQEKKDEESAEKVTLNSLAAMVTELKEKISDLPQAKPSPRRSSGISRNP